MSDRNGTGEERGSAEETGSGRRRGQTPIPAEQLGFGYDPAWNMTNRSVNGTAMTYTVNDLNEAVSEGGANYFFDQNGNRTAKYEKVSKGVSQ